MIGQFSSIGSMGLDKSKWLAGEFQHTLTTTGKSPLRSDPPLHLVRSARPRGLLRHSPTIMQRSTDELSSSAAVTSMVAFDERVAEASESLFKRHCDHQSF